MLPSDGVAVSQLFISVVALVEIRYGVEQSTLPVTEDILLKWRLLLEDGRKTGHTFSQPDLIIAATAAQHGLTIVTRDRTQYDRARIPVINPWD